MNIEAKRTSNNNIELLDILTLFVSVSMWTIHTLRKKTVSLWKQLPCMSISSKKPTSRG